MALTYRSPLEENVAAYDSSVQGVIASTSANYYRDVESNNFQFFNFHLSPVAKKKLIEAGIYLSPYSALPHSHPVCKTLENNILYNVLPGLVDNSFYFVGIKNFKLDLLKLRNSKLSMLNKICRYVTSLDKVRYGSEFVVRSSPPIPGFKRHCGHIDGPTLKELVPEVVARSAKKLFLHDELHYWDHRDLISFLEVVKPEVLYASVVYPPEILQGATSSLNKWCYTFEIVGRDFVFYPDGVHGEGYQQPLKCGYILKAKTITLGDGEVYHVDVVSSKFAHHLVAITKGKSLGPTVRSFGPFEATSCRGLEPVVRDVQHCFPISFEVVSRVYRYLRTLKKPDAQSAMAKLSQLLPEPTGIEIKFLQDFADLVIGTSTINTMIKPARAKIFFGGWLRKLPKILVSRFSVVKELSLDEFVSYMEPYHFQVELMDIGWNYAHSLDLYSMAEADFGVDVVKLIDDRFIYGASSEIVDRTPQPYTSLLACVERRRELIAIPTAALENFCCSVLMSEIFNPFIREISLTRAKEAILRKISHSWCLIMPKKLMVKHIVSGSFMVCLIRRLRSRYCKNLRLDHASYPLLWFLDQGRGYQKYLTGYTEGKHLIPKWHDIYGACVSSVIRGPLPALRKRLVPIEYAGRDYFAWPHGLGASVGPQTPVPLVEEELSPMPDEPLSDSGALEQACGSCEKMLDCTCGLRIEVRNLPLVSMHNFKTLEKLHNRQVGWYSIDSEGYSYNGGSHESLGWPEWLPVWMEINGIDHQYYNCCLYQVYARNGKIGFHADDEDIFVTGSSVCTVNLEGNAVFSIRCSSGCGQIDLSPGVIFTMPEGFQESHKHAVGHASVGRSSLTFRRKKTTQEIKATPVSEEEPAASGDGDVDGGAESNPDSSGDNESGSFSGSSSDSSGTPLVERSYGSLSYSKLPENVFFSTVDVRGDGNCFWRVLELATGMAWVEIKRLVARNPPLDKIYQERFSEQMQNGVYAESESMLSAAYTLHAKLIIYDQGTRQLVTIMPACEVTREVHMHLDNEHFQYLKPSNDCVLQAVSKAVKRQYNEVFAVYTKTCGEEGLDADIWRKDGVNLEDLDSIFKTFDIEATVVCNGEAHVYNAGGSFKACFTLEKGHLEYNKKNPVVDVPILRGEIDALSVSSASICELRARGSTVPYVARKARGETLARSFLSGCTGVLNSQLFNDESSLTGKFLHEGQVLPSEVICLLGTFGAGKSTVFADFFGRNRAKGIFYVSPRRALADEFRRRIGLSSSLGKKSAKKDEVTTASGIKASQRHWHVLTFEVFLKKMHQVKPGMALLIDEVQLYPPGYLDLVLYCLPDGVHVIVGGDPCQSNYDNESDRAVLVEEEQDAIKLLNGQKYDFNVLSKRFKNANFIGRLPCEIEPTSCAVMNEEHLLFTGLDEMCQAPNDYCRVFLVSSFEEKKIVESYMNDCKPKILTFGESTGLNFRKGVILITNVSSAADDRRWVTALSRFSENICFVNLVGTSWEFLAKSYRGRPLGQFLSRKACVEDLKNFLPGNPTFNIGFRDRVGKDEGLKEDKAVGDPWLKGMIDLFQIEDAEEVEEQLEEIQEEWFKTHLPVAELESVRASWVHKLLAKEFREVRMGYNVSEQFTDEYAKEKGKVLTNAAERFEAIYPRHRANDTVTFLMAVKKRLRFSRPATETAKLVEAQNYGAFLLKEFLAKVPIKKGHNEVMMRQAKADFEDKKMSKSAATIENHSGRSCRDWLIDIGLIFSKSQLCTKFDNRFRVAKAAQSIVCFQHEVLCRFAPYMRYIEKKLHEALPSNYYIHSGKGLEELNAWVIKGRFDGVCTESDYEAFDASQDQYIVAFELAMMNYLGLPRDLIEDYKFIKTHLGSKLGNFAIMRFSGEASTFLFNTMANMLFTFLRYEIKGNEHICFAGDDMCASKQLIIKRAHEGFLKKLKLKAKVFMVEKPTFCGWHLSPDGIYKKPQLVLERMCIAKEKANLANCIDNYAIEVSFAYKMGERALNRMDEEEAAAFYNCVRIIIKNKHLLKSDIKNLYSDLE